MFQESEYHDQKNKKIIEKKKMNQMEKLLIILPFEIKITKNHFKKLRMYNKNTLHENVKNMLMAH